MKDILRRIQNFIFKVDSAVLMWRKLMESRIFIWRNYQMIISKRFHFLSDKIVFDKLRERCIHFLLSLLQKKKNEHKSFIFGIREIKQCTF